MDFGTAEWRENFRGFGQESLDRRLPIKGIMGKIICIGKYLMGNQKINMERMPKCRLERQTAIPGCSKKMSPSMRGPSCSAGPLWATTFWKSNFLLAQGKKTSRYKKRVEQMKNMEGAPHEVNFLYEIEFSTRVNCSRILIRARLIIGCRQTFIPGSRPLVAKKLH